MESRYVSLSFLLKKLAHRETRLHPCRLPLIRKRKVNRKEKKWTKTESNESPEFLLCVWLVFCGNLIVLGGGYTILRELRLLFPGGLWQYPPWINFQVQIHIRSAGACHFSGDFPAPAPVSPNSLILKPFSSSSPSGSKWIFLVSYGTEVIEFPRSEVYFSAIAPNLYIGQAPGLVIREAFEIQGWIFTRIENVWAAIALALTVICNPVFLISLYCGSWGFLLLSNKFSVAKEMFVKFCLRTM